MLAKDGLPEREHLVWVCVRCRCQPASAMPEAPRARVRYVVGFNCVYLLRLSLRACCDVYVCKLSEGGVASRSEGGSINSTAC